MDICDKTNILISGISRDVVRQIDSRAAASFRSRSGEVIAILSAVCRGHIVLPAACAVGTEQERAAQAVGAEQARAALAVGAGQDAGLGSREHRGAQV